MAEIDKLEIIIEAEAQKANRSMGSLEKRIDAVTEALERCMLVAQGAVSLKGLNIDKLFSGKAMEKSAKDLGKKLADDLIKNYNLGLAGKNVTGEIKSLTNKIASGVANNPSKAYKNLADDMEALGNVVKRNGRISKSTSSDYQELYNWIKKSGKIKVTPETARSLGDDYKNRTPVMKQKFSTKDGIELDSYYQEMREQFPAILKEAYSVEDEFYQLDSALKKFYETANSFYTPEWMEDDIWDTIIDGVDDIRVGVNDAKTGVTEFGDALKNAEESGKSFSQMLGAGMDISGLERAEALVGNITRGNRTEAQKKTRSDLKYPVQPFKDINRKFKDSRLDTDFSKMNIQQLQASISANERLYARVQQAINNMIELEGTDELGGKDWYSKIMQINQYENAIDDATEALGRLNANSFLSGGVDSQKSNRSTKAIDEYVRKAKEAVGEIPAPSFDTEEELIKYIDDLNDKFEELYQVARKAENEIDFGDAIRELAELESELDSARTDLSHFNNGPRKRKVSNEPIDVGNVSDLYNMTFGDGASKLAKELEQSGASANEAATKLNKDVGSWFGTRRSEIQTGMNSIDTWMNTKYQSARGYVNSAFSNVGTWFGSRKGEIQSNMDSINGWFNTKYQSARGYVNSAFNSIGSWFGSRRNDIQSNMQYISTWFSSTFKTAYNGVTSAFSGIGRYFQNVGDWITSPVKSAINSVGSAVNWIYKKLGGSKDLIPKYATGTGKNGVLNDTFGMVNDQSGGTYRELVQFPNGKAFIPKGRNVVLPMPKGTKVMPAGQTKELMNMNGVPHFKKGAGVFNIIDYIAHPSKLLQYGLDKFTSFGDAVEPGLSIAKQSISAVKNMALSKIKGFISNFTSSSSGGGSYSTSGVEQWRNLAKTALLLTSQYTESNLNALLTQMKHESGGNARAINLWDSNAKKGIPSKGLMQVIDPTFRSYAMAPYNKDIYDPLSNMIASIRYTVSRYGSLYKGWTARGYKGYKNGGMPVNGEVYIANENGFGSEYIGRMGNKHVVANNQQITDGIKQAVIDGMMEVYMATQSNRTDSNSAIPYIINAVLKTEDNEVLARAVEKGQASRSSRFNPSPAY